MRGPHRVRIAGAGRGAAVGDHDEQGPAVRVAEPLGPQHLVRAQQPGGERGAAAGRQLGQPGRGGLHRGGRGQQHPRGRPAERDHAHLVPALVGVQQQGQHRALDRPHPGPGRHRAAGVHQEQDEVALAAFPAGLAQVLAPQPQSARPGPAPLDLVRRGGREGGGQVDLAHRPGGPPRPGDPPGGSPGPGTPAFRARADSGHFEPPDPERGPRCRGGLGRGGPVRPVLGRVASGGDPWGSPGLRVRRYWRGCWGWSGRWGSGRWRTGGRRGRRRWGPRSWPGPGGRRGVRSRPDRRGRLRRQHPRRRDRGHRRRTRRPRGRRRVAAHRAAARRTAGGGGGAAARAGPRPGCPRRPPPAGPATPRGPSRPAR